MSNKSRIKERILQFIEKQGITKSEFYRQTGISNGMLDKNSGVSEKNIDLLLKSYPQLSTKWLIQGEGSMTTSKGPPTLSEKIGTPLIPVECLAGRGGVDVCIAEADVKEYYVVPDFHDIDFMVRVLGNSMQPHYNSGDVVACRLIKDRMFIQWNRVHVLSTRSQGPLIKRLLPGSSADTWKIVSDNPDYPPFDLPTEEVDTLALVVGVIRLE